MVMIRKNAYLVLAVVVLMGTAAVAALADDQGMNAYGSEGNSDWARPEQGVEQPYAGEIREPVETGSVPDFKQSTGEEPAVEIAGQLFRPSVDTGP